MSHPASAAPVQEALDQVADLDASIRDAASAEVQAMHRHANQKKLRTVLKEHRRNRTKRLDKGTQVLVDAKTAKARTRNQARLEAEREAVVKGAGGAQTAADSVEAASDVLTSTWKADALHEEAAEFVRKHMEWAWRITEAALVKFPRKRGVVQFRFVCPDTEHFDTGYINVAIFFVQGYVWALPSTHVGGVAELIQGLPNRTVVLNAASAIGQLPGSPFYSSTFHKSKRAITLSDIDMERVPLMRPSFWGGNTIPSDIVLAGITTKAEYDRVFDTVDKCIALSKKTMAHVMKLEAELARAQAHAEAEAEAEAEARRSSAAS